MKETWRIFEKFLAIIEILVGLSIIILLIYSWSSVFNHMVEKGSIKFSEISIFKLIRNAHFIFLSGVMGVVSGFLLLKNKKSGWILGVSSWLIYFFGTLLIVWPLEKINDSFTNQNYIIIGLFISIFLIMAIAMTLKPFRVKYKSNLKSWVIIGIITLVFLLDKLLIK